MLIKKRSKNFLSEKIYFNIVTGNIYFPYLLTHSNNKARDLPGFFVCGTCDETVLPSDQIRRSEAKLKTA
jgi:hypothetical protein